MEMGVRRGREWERGIQEGEEKMEEIERKGRKRFEERERKVWKERIERKRGRNEEEEKIEE